jgi:hypothetical protein
VRVLWLRRALDGDVEFAAFGGEIAGLRVGVGGSRGSVGVGFALFGVSRPRGHVEEERW